MSEILDKYTALTHDSSRGEVAGVLDSIINALPLTFDDNTRKEIIQIMLDDLRVCTSKLSRLTTRDATQALTAIKTLGRHPSGSGTIVTSSNLSTLLQLITNYRDLQPEVTNEALRCVANALLLVDRGRGLWIDKEIGGGRVCVDILEKSRSPDQIFLVSRILFLSTVSLATAGTFIEELVEQKSPGQSGTIIEIIRTKLDSLTSALLAGTKMSREAMTDLLKFTFNILNHYPKLVPQQAQDTNGKAKKDSKTEERVMGDFWNDRLDGILPPLLRAFNTLPPTFPSPLAPPLTHVIHSLITIPIQYPTLQSQWFAGPKSSPSSSTHSSPKSRSATSSSVSPTNTTKPAPPPSGSSSGRDSPAPPSSGKTKIDRALSKLGRRSVSSRSSSPHTPLTPTSDVLLRAYDLLEVSLRHYCPGDIDPDDPSVRERCRKEGDHSLDDMLSPLVVLTSRLCQADEGSRARMREWMIPSDLDRSSPLETRTDLLGRCLRLLGSVYHVRLKDAVGEMLLAMCDSDAGSLAAHVGYGNVAGFLYNKGIMAAPPRPANSNIPTTTADGQPINPITGTVQHEAPPVEMTEEEKEEEAEKLFVLFDRLERTGALPPNQNPIRRAMQGSSG